MLWPVWQNLLDQILDTTCGFSGREGGREGGESEVYKEGQEPLSKEKIGEFVGEINCEFHMAVLE